MSENPSLTAILQSRKLRKRLIAFTLVVPIFLLASSAIAAPADDTPPVIDLTDSDGHMLINGTVFSSNDINIICLAQDDLSEITKVEYSIDGSSFKHTSISGGLHSTTISLESLEEGNHTIAVRAANNASLSAEISVTFSVNLDSAPTATDSPIWGLLSAVAGITGLTLASVIFFYTRKNRPKTPVESMRSDELPPIM